MMTRSPKTNYKNRVFGPWLESEHKIYSIKKKSVINEMDFYKSDAIIMDMSETKGLNSYKSKF